jgi:2-polyprenyl-3-methyl-5-hydroxy-6-metoxy-1,4-benzoquinol methylase
MHQDIQAFYDRKYTTGTEVARTSKTYAIDCVPVSAGRELLDVGCGSGENSRALAEKGFKVHGVDISPAAIERYCRQGFDGRVCDIEGGLGYPQASFDIVFCSEVIEHMVSPELLVGEMARVLKPGGHLVLSTPNSGFWLYRLLGMLGYTVSELQHPKHFQFFSQRSLIKLLKSAPLVLVQATGRNMYAILPDLPPPVGSLLMKIGFRRETRFRTGGHFLHCSHRSSFWNALFADTLIIIMRKQA